MLGLAKWLQGQRIRRVAFIAGLFPLPVLGLLSAAAVVMTAQLNGFRNALFDCIAALGLVAAISWAAGMDVPLVVTSAVISWSVWLVLGEALHRTGSLTLAAQAAVVMALTALLLANVIVDDPVGYWAAVLDAVYQDLSDQGVAVEADVELQAGMMTGLIVTGSLIGSLFALLLGNSWARSVTAGEGPAPSQFDELKLGYVIGGLAAIAGLLRFAGIDTGGALLIFGAAFTFQGVAVLVWWSRKLGFPRGWWLGLCILAILLPTALYAGLLLFAVLGFVDNWYSLRISQA